jgi:hypothetical protein
MTENCLEAANEEPTSTLDPIPSCTNLLPSWVKIIPNQVKKCNSD